MANTFLVSVADAIGRDPNTKNAIFTAKANMSSAFTLSMQNTEVRGGKNNPLLFNFYHDRALEITLQQATFSKQWLALNVGENIINSNVTVVANDCVTFTAGAGVVAETPLGNVTLFKEDGTLVTVTPTDKNVTIAGYTGKATAVYEYTTLADRVAIGSTKPPAIIDLSLTAEVRDNRNNVVELLQINIPAFQVTGNYELSFAADGVGNESLNGSALSVSGATCADGDIYGYATWIPQSANAVVYADIAATPAIWQPAAGVLTTQQISVMGLRGGIYANSVVTEDCTFTKLDGDVDITVSAGGLVSCAATAVSGDQATLQVALGDLIDIVMVDVQ